MPIYAYRCSVCGHAKDVLQKLSDPLLSICPACGAETFTKQVTAAGFQLKGSGWYATDFKSSGAAPVATAEGDAKSDAKSDAKADAKPDVKSDVTSDAKPEAKSEAKSDPKADTKAAGTAAAAPPASPSGGAGAAH